jgi:oligopeptide/dipeptide ABC transporter ATP-binding protein
MTPLIETIDLKKYFRVPKGSLRAVDGVSIAIEKRRTLGVVGESGCGKSTLGSLILRLLEPTSGDVRYHGRSILSLNKKEMKEIRQKMQMIFQDPYSSLNPRMSVSELIAEPMIVNKTLPGQKAIFERTYRLMETVGLARRMADVYPHELDGGRRQRIGVARALALNPEFIVCDEPVSALDVSIQAQILNLLMDLQEEMGLTYMFITHDLSVVKHISNQIAVMYLGQCVELASSEALFARPAHPYTQALLAAIPVISLDAGDAFQNLIQGEVASPIDPEPGCRFAPRCEYRADICVRETPALASWGEGHWVACPIALREIEAQEE